MERFEHWINGVETKPQGGQYLTSTNPAGGEMVSEIPRGTAADVDAAAIGAAAGQVAWAAMPLVDRARTLTRLAELIRTSADELVSWESAETAKPLQTAQGEIHACADYFEYYGALTRSLHGQTVEVGDDRHIFVRREPFGVVGVIMPWNGPLILAARSVAPALAAGNAVVLKPSEFTSVSSLIFGRLASSAGLPVGALQVITGTGPEAGAALTEHPKVRRLAFTGSVRAGREVARRAAERLIPVSLELGGKSPNIVFADADLEAAIPAAVRAFTTNTGQACWSGTRLLVERSIHDDVVAGVLAHASTLRPRQDLGPLITEAQYEKVREYFNVARADGSTPLIGGEMEPGEGFFVAPTVYDNVDNHARIAQEEIFGPVLSVIPFDTETEAVALANDTSYGLTAGVWTNDINRALRMAARLEVGQVLINTWTLPMEAPFGGYKNSGYGREKGMQAIEEYTQSKSVVIAIR